MINVIVHTFSLVATSCGLIAAVSWGTADYFATKATRNLSPLLTSIYVSFLTIIASLAVYLIYPQHSTGWTGTGMLYALGSGVFIGSGLLMFYHGLEVGPVSVVSPIGSAYPLVTTLVVLFLLNGHLSALQIAGIILVVLGIVATSGLLTAKKSERRLTSGVIYALVTFLLWGIGFALVGEAVSHLGWVKASLFDVVVEFFVISIMTFFFKERPRLKELSVKGLINKYILLVAFIQLLGLIVFSIGLTRGVSTAVITAISSSYPALTIFLALKHLNEKATIISLGGALITVSGIVLLSLK